MTVSEFQKKFNIAGKSKEIKDLVDIAMQVAQSDISVLLTGESGTGKEVFARAIHGSSNRSNKELVSVNCGAIPESLLESELFGHKKGSYTGAHEDRKGYFEIADGGTLFLDEIGELPLTTQVKLLRVLETKEFMRIGSETLTKVDVRIIAATNKDLQREVDARRFRSDLYFRLKAVTLTIPPLRERREDITELIYLFLNNYSKNNKITPPEITDDGIDVLYNYSFPGNVRELKNIIETAVALSRTGKLDKYSFIPHFTKFENPEDRNLPIFLQKPSESIDRELIFRALLEIKKDLLELKSLAEKNNSEYPSYHNFNSQDANEIIPLETLEKQAIINALNFTKNNKRKAAKLLKINERTLYRKIKDYDLS